MILPKLEDQDEKAKIEERKEGIGFIRNQFT